MDHRPAKGLSPICRNRRRSFRSVLKRGTVVSGVPERKCLFERGSTLAASSSQGDMKKLDGRLAHAPGQTVEKHDLAFHDPVDLASSCVFGDDADGRRATHDES